MNEINALKIDYIIPDMSLIIGIEDDFEKQRYVSALVTYAISKNCDLLIVGVENQRALETLKSLGVRYVQGYYFSKPDTKVVSMNKSVRKKLEEVMQDSIS